MVPNRACRPRRQADTTLPYRVGGAVWDLRVGQQVRVAIEYGASWRAVMWFEVGADASVYLGPRRTSVETLRSGAFPSESSTVHIDYRDGRDVVEPRAWRNPTKLSFHGSGQINAGDARLDGDSLRQLSEQRLLCVLLFEHPSRYEPLTAFRARDIRLPYPVHEGRPMYAQVYVAPAGEMRPVTTKDGDHFNLVFDVSGVAVAGMQGLALQIVFTRANNAPWPPMTYVVFRSRKTPLPR
jgi:hypothetical protein